MQLSQVMPWTPLAVLAYAATIVVGTLSATGRRVPRSWHTVLFVATAVITAIAMIEAFFEQWQRGVVLMIALVPICLLPFVTVPVRRRQRRHILLGLSAAPLFLLALALWLLEL